MAMDDLTQDEKEGLMGYIYFFADENPTEDCEKAKYWFEKAAEKGHASAQKNLEILIQKMAE